MRELTGYQAIIVDMDGTLYYQKPVRLYMLKEMLFEFWRFPEFIIVQKYRKLYEIGMDEKDRLCRLPKGAHAIIREWMTERPLPYIYQFRDQKLIDILNQVHTLGTKVIVYSDYPLTEKLKALKFNPDMAFSAQETECLKPDPSGLTRILLCLGIAPEKCLVIGDRLDKDGEMAKRMGSDYLILPKENREAIYSSMTG